MAADNPIRLAVFDCDGTLVDGQHVIVAAMTAAWGAHGLPAPAPEAVRRVVGLPLETAIAMLLPEADMATAHDLAGRYREAFRALRRESDYFEPLFPGVAEALDALEGAEFVLGLATGKSRRGVEATLSRHGLWGRFVTVQTSDNGPGKPSPDMLLRAMGEVGARACDTVMIGDTVFDMEMARNADILPIGVAWGYHEADELRAAGAEAVVESFADVADTVARLTGRPR